MRIFLTGGTGFVGGHVAEAAVEAGHVVRALVRPTSDVIHLQSLGVELAEGDLTNMASLLAAAEGCDVVVHAAAKVGDWGSWREYHEQTVQAARRVYDAAVAVGVDRAVHVSSTAVYGYRRRGDGPIDEARGPVPAHRLPRWYGYGRAKSLAESLAMQYHRDGLLRMSVIRPGWIYGPRDRCGLLRLFSMLRRGSARCIGDGSNLLSLTYVANVADAILLAATHDRAVGEAYNVANDHGLTQRRYLNSLADLLGVPRPVDVPYALALGTGWVLETAHRLLGLHSRPALTRQAVKLASLSGDFSTDKIRRQLGWSPRVDFAAALVQIKAWAFANAASVPRAEAAGAAARLRHAAEPLPRRHAGRHPRLARHR